ncbi:hypothetical protein FB451DRAFT_1366938 [Mycena latifolia]|nr:hypothetical protein FB451DRAFT_1366938 [Mycena latifolia]
MARLVRIQVICVGCRTNRLEPKALAKAVVASSHDLPHGTSWTLVFKTLVYCSMATQDGRYPMHHVQSYRHPDRYSRESIFRFPGKPGIVPEISSLKPLNGNTVRIKDGKSRLVDGTTLEGIDEIILATGYRRNPRSSICYALFNILLEPSVNPVTFDNLHWTGHYIHDPTLTYASGEGGSHLVICAPRSRICQHPTHGENKFAQDWTGKARLSYHKQIWRDHLLFLRSPCQPLDVVALIRQYVAWLNSESWTVLTHENYMRFDNFRSNVSVSRAHLLLLTLTTPLAPLSAGACGALYRMTSEPKEEVYFVLQITRMAYLINVHPFNYYLTLSDGVNTMNSILSNELNDLVELASPVGHVVVLTQIRSWFRPRWGKRIMVIEGMHIIENQNGLIGPPTGFRFS